MTSTTTLSGVLRTLEDDPAIARAIEVVDTSLLDITAPAGLMPFVIAALAGAGRPVLAVTATERQGQNLTTALRSLLPAETVVEYPAWETLPHERLSPRADTVGRRLAVLRRLHHPSADDPSTGPVSVVVAPVRSLLQPQPPGLGDLEPVALRVGTDADFEAVIRALSAIAYTRVDLVERRGEFAVRGGILDVFPPTEDHPVRVEFWGDTVEEIRYFAVADQRSLGVAEHGLWAPPCRELLLTEPVRERARELAVRHPELAEMLDKLAAGIPVEGMEALAPVLLDHLVLLVDELPAGTHVVVCDSERVRSRATDLVSTSREFLAASWAAAAGGGQAPIDLGAAAYQTLADVRSHALDIGVPWWTASPFMADAELDPHSVTSTARDAESYRGDIKGALDDVRGWLRADWRVVLVTEGHGSAERMVEVLRGEDIAARLAESLDAELAPGVVQVTTGGLNVGITSEALRVAVLCESDLSGGRPSMRDEGRMPSKRRGTIDPITLRAGDIVVHQQHGVGRYVDLVTRTCRRGNPRIPRHRVCAEQARPARRPAVRADRLTRPGDEVRRR